MANELRVLLVKDASEAKTRTRIMKLNGSTEGKNNQIAIVGVGAETYVWIGETGCHVYGILNHADMKLLVDLYNDAITAEAEVRINTTGSE
jgi:flagellar biogenesis protein FliO